MEIAVLLVGPPALRNDLGDLGPAQRGGFLVRRRGRTGASADAGAAAVLTLFGGIRGALRQASSEFVSGEQDGCYRR